MDPVNYLGGGDVSPPTEGGKIGGTCLTQAPTDRLWLPPFPPLAVQPICTISPLLSYRTPLHSHLFYHPLCRGTGSYL